MQEEKNSTTPGKTTEGKHRRRRKKSAAVKPQPAVQETAVAAPAEETAPKETDAQAAAKAVPDKQEEPSSAVAAGEKKADSEGAPVEEKSSEMAPAEPEKSEPTTPEEEQTETPEPSEPAESAEPAVEEPPTEKERPAEPEEVPSEPEAPEANAESAAAEPDPAEETEKADQEPEENRDVSEEAAVPGESAVTAEPEQPAAEEPASPDAEKEPEPGEEQAVQPGQPEAETKAEEEPEEPSGDEAAETSREDEQRLSDLTRTVQLSVEQIMSQVSEETAGATEDPAEESSEEEEAEDEPATLQENLRSGLSGMAKWLLLVAFIVLVIAGFGVAWLYRSATPDMLPQITATFAGQTLEPTAYKWKVPVIGNIFKRTYADTLSSTPVELSETVDQASPDFVISPSDYRTEVTVTDAGDNVVFEGDTDTFSTFQFTANGTYTAKLVVHSDASSVPGDTSVTGSETWYFTFTVGVRPSIRLSGTTVDQGSVVAVRVGDTLDGQAPTIQTELQNPGFFKASSGWVCYIPIAWNQAAGTQTLTVTAGGYTETLEFKIRATEWEYKDYSSNSQRVSPYIGQNDIPAELQKLLAESESEVAWSDGGFVQPFLNTLDVKLAFGTTEYVGRSYSQRSTNNGAGGRTATNLVLDTKSGELLIAPASGTVVLAKDLGGDFGYTLVIDHGAGVKSIFYNLAKVDVKAGDAVKQGQTLATCGKTTVAEMRIGAVPVDPLQIWRGQCDALKNY